MKHGSDRAGNDITQFRDGRTSLRRCCKKISQIVEKSDPAVAIELTSLVIEMTRHEQKTFLLARKFVTFSIYSYFEDFL